MSKETQGRDIRTRKQLYDFLQSQMQTAYRDLREKQRLESESGLIKSYIFEVDLPQELRGSQAHEKELRDFIQTLFSVRERGNIKVEVTAKDEEGFFELNMHCDYGSLALFIDTITNPRFWFGFSLSKARFLDRYLEAVASTKGRFDFIWLWPAFLEDIQKRGIPRGFGLDYDYRNFEPKDTEKTTYLKMQLWGGRETAGLYKSLRRNKEFRDKIVLSKVRLKASSNGSDDDLFALEDIKYTGKFTTRGTDFRTHLATISTVRKDYEKKIRSIEEDYVLRWKRTQRGSIVLEGFAIHFIPPRDFLIDTKRFCEVVLNATLPFRLMGFVDSINDSFATAQVIDLHTGGEFSLEIYPDLLSVYLSDNICGNSIARLYTNLQHLYNAEFIVEADNGEKVF